MYIFQKAGNNTSWKLDQIIFPKVKVNATAPRSMIFKVTQLYVVVSYYIHLKKTWIQIDNLHIQYFQSQSHITMVKGFKDT